MLEFLLNTKKEPLSFDFEVAVNRPSRIRVKVINPDKPNTVYFDRWKDVADKVSFEVKMPQSAKVSKLLIGDIKNSNDDNVRLSKKIERKKLITLATCSNGNGGNSSKVREFVKFAQEFCENASIYGVGSYYSDKGTFRIDYFDVITEGGKQLTTPARIHNDTGRMEVAKKGIINCTVPSRMAILLHEFSHFNLNEEQHDETEADLNALKIYLGMGYPPIEAHKGFLDVFKTAPSNGNRIRYDYLKSYIDNFDEQKYRLCLP